MKVIKNTITVLLFILFSINVNAAETAEESPKAQLRGPAEFQKVIDEYKDYLAKVPAKVRDEVIEYRKSIAKLNKQKRLLYRQLSQDSQNFLKKEQQYKKKLPLNRKSLINIENPGGNSNNSKSTNK